MKVIDEKVVKLEKQIENNNEIIAKLTAKSQKNEKVAHGARKFNKFFKKGVFLIPFLPAVGYGVYNFSVGVKYTLLSRAIFQSLIYPANGAVVALGILALGAVIGGIALCSKFNKQNKCEALKQENQKLLEIIKEKNKENNKNKVDSDEKTKTVDKQTTKQVKLEKVNDETETESKGK